MFVIILRLLIFIAIIYLIYITIRYITNPKRKLEHAQEQKTFYFLDDPNDVRKNFLFTYKGVRFEGEKYLGATEHSFTVVSILVWTNEPEKLKGLNRSDFHFLEKEILIRYHDAKIEWKSPIKEFLQEG